MKEILLEIELLFNKMNEVNDDTEREFGNDDIPFAKILFAITRSLERKELFGLTDQQLIKHIQKIQLIEG
jgi:hypothetical protein